MKEMTIFVPTHRRLDYQLTLRNLPKEWQERTIVVCPKDEIHSLHNMFPRVEVVSPDPKAASCIANKRAWIFNYAGEACIDKILMFDDDLQFSYRRICHQSYKGYQKGDPKEWPAHLTSLPALGKLVPAEKAEMNTMLRAIEKMLDTYRHGGISQRFMNHVHGHEFILNHKATHALAYHVPTVLAKCQLGRVRIFEDLDYTLQLLRAGYENAIYQWGATNDPRGFNAPGGESGNRKMDDISQGADLMAKLHPGIVRVVERKGSDADRLGPKRIVVAWKKAIKEGKNEAQFIG